MAKPSLDGGLEDPIHGLNAEASQLLTIINDRGGDIYRRTLVIYCTVTLRWPHALIESAVGQLSMAGMIEPVAIPLDEAFLSSGRFKVTPKGASF